MDALQVPRAPPRPELSQLLGVTYRRIPVLAIGRDLYCDSASIADAIERRFPPSTGYITLFPTRAGGGKADTGLVKAFVKFYSDTILFGLAVIFLPWDKFPQAFLDDRSKVGHHSYALLLSDSCSGHNRVASRSANQAR